MQATLKTYRSIQNAILLVTATGICSLAGCVPGIRLPKGPLDTKKSYYDKVSTRIEYPDVKTGATNGSISASATGSPFALEDPSQLPAWEMSLEEAIQTALSQGPVLRNLGGATTTSYDPALSEANPLGGVEAALADFDAQFAGGIFWQKDNAPLNVPAGFGAFQPTKETRANYTSEISKTTATGASFAARHNVIYTRPNTQRLFPSDFSGFFETEWRQPLARGRGTQFNRIAGPNSPVGQYNGVLIARVNQDISLATFESGVIDLAANVEQAYWDLYFAYRNLEAQLRGREAALQTFQYQELRLKVGAGRSDEEAQARSQFYQFQVQVENGLAGEQGLYTLEQRLRLLLGLPASDGRIIKPTTNPHDAEMIFDWNSALTQGLQRHVEVRQQKWNVKKRQLELCAARLNKRPQFDFLGQYRWRGLGDHLIGNNQPLNGLYPEIAGGDYQEWQAGLELSFPIGMRRASVAIAHAKLNLSREQALLGERQLQVSHRLSNAARELQRQYQLLKTNFNRWTADRRQLDVLRERYQRGADNINFLLQAQRQVITSETDYYRTLVAYNVAIRDLHTQKGTLLAYNHIHLSEGQWNSCAYREGYDRGRSFTPCKLPQKMEIQKPVSHGRFDPSVPVSTSGIMHTEGQPEVMIDILEPAPVFASPEFSSRYVEPSGQPENQIDAAAPMRLPAAPQEVRQAQHIAL